MPQFFFNFRDEAGLDRDQEELDLPDLDAAYMEAFEAAKEMWIETIRDMRNPMRQSFEIVDADNKSADCGALRRSQREPEGCA